MIAAQKLVVPSAICSLACPIRSTNDPAANPYRLEFAVVLGLLLSVLVIWQRVRPRPRCVLRMYAGVGGAFAFVTMLAEACTQLEPTQIDYGCQLVLDATLLVSGSLLLEIALSLGPRSVLARAIARVRNRR